MVLLTLKDDQGAPGEVLATAAERFRDVPSALPLVLSGSSYVARYTGAEFAPAAITAITGVIAALAIFALFLPGRRRAAWACLLGTALTLSAFLLVADRFTLRYFFPPVLGAWILAGAGLGALVERARRAWPRLASGAPVVAAVALVGWSAAAILLPFLRTGGSTADFSLGNRTDSAAAFVDTRPLLACLRGAGPVSSENVHIRNRLTFLQHEETTWRVEEAKEDARVLVSYRKEPGKSPDGVRERCEDLRHFVVEESSGE